MCVHGAGTTRWPRSSWILQVFGVFTNRMNNYPGVAANSGADANSAWLQTSANEEKNLPNPSPNPLLSILLLDCSPHSVSLFFFLLCFPSLCLSLSLRCVNHLLCLPPRSKAFALAPPSVSVHLFFFLFAPARSWITEIHEQKISYII